MCRKHSSDPEFEISGSVCMQVNLCFCVVYPLASLECCEEDSGAPSHEVKDEPQNGIECEADAFMNVMAELLRGI